LKRGICDKGKVGQIHQSRNAIYNIKYINTFERIPTIGYMVFELSIHGNNNDDGKFTIDNINGRMDDSADWRNNTCTIEKSYFEEHFNISWVYRRVAVIATAI
jgi:hypothetical protein